MSKRIVSAFILTCITALAAAVPLSACAPKLTLEPTLAQKVKDAVILEYNGGANIADLTIESLIPAANSQEVASCLDKLRNDTGQTNEEGNLIYKYNFDYIKEVIQSDAATVDDALYNALIIAFAEMPDKDKGTFLECAYIKAEDIAKWNVSPVISEMTRRSKGLLENMDVTFKNLVDRDFGIQELIFSYSVLRQAEKYASLESSGGFSNVNVSIERVPDRESDAVLNFGVSDDKGNVNNLYTVNVLAFRGHIMGVLNMVIKNTAPYITETHAQQLVADGNASYALYMGATISYTNDGQYEVNLSAIDPFRLNMALRAFAKAKENDGLGCSAIEVAKAIKNGKAEELVSNEITIYDYIDWYQSYGDSKSSDYYDMLKIAYDEHFRQNKQNASIEELTQKTKELSYEDMVKLEQDYPECFDY